MILKNYICNQKECFGFEWQYAGPKDENVVYVTLTTKMPLLKTHFILFAPYIRQLS
jgi:hypothetical protein